jgi:rhodanese-related sulfurtransferase
MEQLFEFLINRWILTLTFFGLIGLLIGTEISRRLRGFKDVSPLDATQLVNHEDAVFLDIREDREYKEGHIPKAKHIPLAALEHRMKELEKVKGKPIIAYCRTGHRSARACSMLQRQGFEPVYNLGGGLLAWQNNSYPVSKK